jgi:hypothetical protein
MYNASPTNAMHVPDPQCAAQDTQTLTCSIVQSSPPPPPLASPSPHLHNHLQLPRITQRILDNLIARHHNILARRIGVLLLREIDASVLDDPARLFSKTDDATFRVEEQQRFGVCDGDRGVCFFAAGGDFFADGADEDLEGGRVSAGRERDVCSWSRVGCREKDDGHGDRHGGFRGTYLREQRKLLTRHPLTLRLPPNPIIAPLHQRLLQPNRILNELIILEPLARQTCRHLQRLKQSMEFRIIAITQ